MTSARSATDERLYKEERLRKRPQFLHAQRRGSRGEGRHVVVYAVPNDVGRPRLGLTVSKRVGKAVTRNRWKRRLREIFRRDKDRFGGAHDVVIIVKRGRRGEPSYQELERDVWRAVGRALKGGKRRQERRR